MELQSKAAGFNKSLASAATKECHWKFLCLEDRVVESRRMVARIASFRMYLSSSLSLSLSLFLPVHLSLPSLPPTVLNANNTITGGACATGALLRQGA